jgi:membrane protease YdiL (CAAX protease family)
LTVLGLLGVAAFISYAVPSGFTALSESFESAQMPVKVLGGIVATLLLSVVGLAYLRRHAVPIAVCRPTRRDWAWLAGGLVVSMLGVFVFAILESIFDDEAAATTGSALTANTSTLTVLLAAVYFLMVIGPIEGLLFRGVIQGLLRQSFRPAAAIRLGSVGFSLAHIPNVWLAGSDSASVVISLAGIIIVAAILGAIYEWAANLTVVVLIHGLLNATLFALAVGLGGLQTRPDYCRSVRRTAPAT